MIEHRNYKEFKNILHNELGVTREEIRDLIKETIKNEIDWLINDRRDAINEHINASVSRHMKKLIEDGITTQHGLWKNDGIRDSVKRALKDEIVNTLFSDIEISFDIKKKDEQFVVDDKTTLSDFAKMIDGDL